MSGVTEKVDIHDVQDAIDVIKDECPAFFWTEAILTSVKQVRNASDELKSALRTVFQFRRQCPDKNSSHATWRRANHDKDVVIEAIPRQKYLQWIEELYTEKFFTKTQVSQETGIPRKEVHDWTEKEPRLAYADDRARSKRQHMYYRRSKEKERTA